MPLRRARGVLAGRGLLLLPLAALAVHQLRYLLAYGSSAGHALAAQGHGYVNSLAPWLGVLLALGAGRLIMRVAAGLNGHAVPTRRAFAVVWAVAVVALLLLYVAQETLEELFATGHPSGLAGVFGHGGLWAIPLSFAFGAIVAACVSVADDLVEFAIAARGRLTWLATAVLGSTPTHGAVSRGTGFAWLGRGPPRALHAAV